MFKVFEDHPVLALLSERRSGNMSLRTDDPNVRKNRDRFFSENKIDATQVVSAGLVHGGRVASVGYGSVGSVIPGVDALCTSHKELTLAITVADCLPIFFLVPGKMIGLAHAGRKPLCSGIIGEMTQYMFCAGCRPADVLVGIGPGIARCCYEVQGDVADDLLKWGSDVLPQKSGATFLDLKMVVRRQLRAAGIRREHIETHLDCTHCDPRRYYSYRHDKKSPPDTMIATMSMSGM
jgi:polyphenol oxidase